MRFTMFLTIEVSETPWFHSCFMVLGGNSGLTNGDFQTVAWTGGTMSKKRTDLLHLQIRQNSNRIATVSKLNRGQANFQEATKTNNMC